MNEPSRSHAAAAFVMVASLAIGSLVTPSTGVHAQDGTADGPRYARPDLLQQFATGRYETTSLELSQYGLALYDVIEKRCGVPEPIKLAAERLRSSIKDIGVAPGHAAGIQDAEAHHAAYGCSGEGQRFRIQVLRYINTHQEVPRSAWYAAQPPSLFNACVRDSLRRWEGDKTTFGMKESSIRTGCECAARMLERYVTPEHRRGLLADYLGYMKKLQEARDPLAYRVNPCRG